MRHIRIVFESYVHILSFIGCHHIAPMEIETIPHQSSVAHCVKRRIYARKNTEKTN